MRLKWISLLLCLFLLAGCSVENNGGDRQMKTNAYAQITAEEAKAMMEVQEEYVLLDVRSEEEFAQGHIEGAVLIPDHEIAARAEEELPDRESVILVYCRSGRRSKLAAQTLVDLGYLNVYEFGGILDWPFETVK